MMATDMGKAINPGWLNHVHSSARFYRLVTVMLLMRAAFGNITQESAPHRNREMRPRRRGERGVVTAKADYQFRVPVSCRAGLLEETAVGRYLLDDSKESRALRRQPE